MQVTITTQVSYILKTLAFENQSTFVTYDRHKLVLPLK